MWRHFNTVIKTIITYQQINYLLIALSLVNDWIPQGYIPSPNLFIFSINAFYLSPIHAPTLKLMTPPINYLTSIQAWNRLLNNFTAYGGRVRAHSHRNLLFYSYPSISFIFPSKSHPWRKNSSVPLTKSCFFIDIFWMSFHCISVCSVKGIILSCMEYAFAFLVLSHICRFFLMEIHLKFYSSSTHPLPKTLSKLFHSPLLSLYYS